ncbi:ATP-dependent nuclease [Pseudomonas germanica]|uniref:ATP-dependent nuclease n=1 Tax=Pseudomonas germanica TaxID=2815720 RepID=UPI002A4E1E48|nr:AAA family ATPase [Pseudomonas germanica]WPN77233.1 AAA family ATPase [Pseudomonas germanica]
MSVRAASFGDDWRRVFHRNYSECVKEISISNSLAIEDANISLGRGIVALVGGNGVGKSTLAHAIVEGLLNFAATPDLLAQQNRIDGVAIDFRISKEGNTHTRKVSFGNGTKIVEGEDTVSCIWIDPSLFSMMCRQQINGDKTFEEILDGITPKLLTDEQLQLASYVVGKDYETCEVWEVSEYGPFEVWPYFRVGINGVVYGSETMGQGELALLSALWTVQRSPDNSLVILEEPETHVSSRSQLAFMDFLAREGGRRGISFLLTTHSPVILQRIPLSNTYLLLANGSRSCILTPPRSHHISSLLGGGISYKALLVIEDETAKVFCETIIEQIDPDFARQVSFVVARDGESEIVKVLNTMPRVQGWATLIGCFDGDQREHHRTLNLPWPHVFLPGIEPPDQILKNRFRELDQESVARELRVDPRDLLVAIASTAGVDFHDWAGNMSRSLNIGQAEFVRGVTKVWLVLFGDADSKVFVETVRRSLA